MADVRVSEVCVSISAANVSSVHSVASCEVVNHEILEDIDYVVEEAGSGVKKSPSVYFYIYYHNHFC